MDLNGVVGHVVQGTKVLLECTVRAARPAANITWQNGTEVLNESNDRLQMHETKVEENVSTNIETILNVHRCKIDVTMHCLFYSLHQRRDMPVMLACRQQNNRRCRIID